MKKNMLIILFCLSTPLMGQSFWASTNHPQWSYCSISDTLYSEVDSIRFVISKPFKREKPTVFFLQGSGNYPIFLHSNDSVEDVQLLPPFSIDDHVNDFNFVVIAKPGTPICNAFKEEAPPLIDTNFGDYPLFTKMDFLHYYVAQLGQVVDDVRKRSSADAPFFFIGNSQGGRVVAKFTERYPEKVQRLVLQSTSILDRYLEQVYHYRSLADQGKISSEEAQKSIDDIYAYYDYLKKYSDFYKNSSNTHKQRPTSLDHDRIMTDASFNFDLVLFQLQNIECPILVVYGTADLKARDNDLLPFFFSRWNKKNLSMMPILDCDHIFMRKSNDPSKGEYPPQYIGEDVFHKIMDWFSQRKEMDF